MRRPRPSYKQMAVGGLELFGLFAISGLISLRFPQWIPSATVNPMQREWASVFSALSLLACGISLRAFGSLTKAYSTDPKQWQTSYGPALKWTSMGIDAAAFLWSTRACTNRDTAVATVAVAVAYIGFPAILKRLSANTTTAVHSDGGERYLRIVAAATLVGLVCVLASSLITEL